MNESLDRETPSKLRVKQGQHAEWNSQTSQTMTLHFNSDANSSTEVGNSVLTKLFLTKHQSCYLCQIRKINIFPLSLLVKSET